MKILLLIISTGYLCLNGYSQIDRSEKEKEQRYQFSHRQMGTKFNIIFYSENDSMAQKIANQVWRKIDNLNQQMSDYLPESELNLLCKKSGDGNYYSVSDELWEVLWLSKKMAKKSKGAFDPTIGPLSRLWRRGMRRQEVPEPGKIIFAKSLVNYRLIQFKKKDHSIRLKKRGIKLDLGGIAKGYAVDKAFEIIESYGINAILVDGGGDLRLGKSPPGKAGWSVEISGLNNQGESYSETVELSQCSIATSGAKYRYVEDNGIRYSHIIDPRSGMGVTAHRLVTIISPNCTQADALASIVSVAGFEQGKKFSKKIMGKQKFSIRFTQPESKSNFKTYYYHNN